MTGEYQGVLKRVQSSIDTSVYFTTYSRVNRVEAS